MRARKWVRWATYALTAIAVLVTALVLAFLLVRPEPGEFVLRGSAVEMGEAYGKEARWQLKLLNRFYIDRVVCRNDAQVVRARHTVARSALANWPEPYVAEVHAMAKSSGLGTGAIAYANCFLDLGQAQAGCRSVVVQNNELFLHAHNLDWDSLAGLGRWTTSIVRRHPSDGRFRTVSVGFPGLIGSLDILNEKGLALSFNQLGTSKGSTNEPVFILLRRVAETCSTLAEAREMVMAAPAGMPFIITVSDAAASTGAVFERTREKIIERRMNDGWVAACNVSQEGGRATTSLDRVLEATPIGSTADLQRVLSDDRVLLGSNLYSVIFDFRGNRLLLASGSVPAAGTPYRECVLFE